MYIICKLFYIFDVNLYYLMNIFFMNNYFFMNTFFWFTSSFLNRGFLKWGSTPCPPCPPCPRPWRPVFPPRWWENRKWHGSLWSLAPNKGKFNGLNVVFQCISIMEIYRFNMINPPFFHWKCRKKCRRTVTDHGTDLDHGKQLTNE
jgi:hypothetical protein